MMVRELTKIEEGFIRSSVQEGVSIRAIARELNGVGSVTVQAYVDTLVSTPVADIEIEVGDAKQPPVSPFVKDPDNEEPTLTPEDMEKREGESEIERMVRLAVSKTKPAELMQRDVKNGVVTMTPEASDLNEIQSKFHVDKLSPAAQKRLNERVHQPFDLE